MPDIKILNPDVLGKPLGQYSQITRVKASEFLFIAGQVGADNNGKMVPITKVRIKANPTSLSPLLVARRFAGRQLSDSRSSYHKSGQSIAPRIIAIRIDPQIIDVPRDAAGFTVEVRYSLETN